MPWEIYTWNNSRWKSINSTKLDRIWPANLVRNVDAEFKCINCETGVRFVNTVYTKQVGGWGDEGLGWSEGQGKRCNTGSTPKSRILNIWSGTDFLQIQSHKIHVRITYIIHKFPETNLNDSALKEDDLITESRAKLKDIHSVKSRGEPFWWQDYKCHDNDNRYLNNDIPHGLCSKILFFSPFP